MMPERELHLEKLVLIIDSPESQRLVATWETAHERYHHLLPDVPPLMWADGAPRFIDAWATMARVDVDDLASLIPVLFENDILLPEGEVAEEALNFVRVRMMDALQKPPR